MAAKVYLEIAANMPYPGEQRKCCYTKIVKNMVDDKNLVEVKTIGVKVHPSTTKGKEKQLRLKQQLQKNLNRRKQKTSGDTVLPPDKD